MLCRQSGDGPIGASQRRVSRSGRVPPQDGDGTSARDLPAEVASSGDAQSVDQGEVWAAPVQRAWVKQGGDGGVVGVSELQHLRVDTPALEASRSGGAARVEKKGEEGRVGDKIG